MAKDTEITVEKFMEVRAAVAEAAESATRIQGKTATEIAETLLIRGFIDIPTVLAWIYPPVEAPTPVEIAKLAEAGFGYEAHPPMPDVVAGKAREL